jgi:hypothetical protein
VHYTPDPALMFHQTRHFRACIPLYDACVTTKTFEIERYKQAGAKAVVLGHQGYPAEMFKSELLREARNLDVCFIGHCEDFYVECLRNVSQVTQSLGIWGKWEKQLRSYPELASFWRGPGLWNEDYSRALASAKVSLGLLSKWIPEQVTTRSFEIPAAGTMMLAERTDEHLAAFTEGLEAEFFGTMDEMRCKLQFYLKNDELRARIAENGRKRCVRAGYDYSSRLRALMTELQEILQLPRAPQQGTVRAAYS